MVMTAEAISDYLHTHIPLSKAMNVAVESLDDGVILSAPLAPNINHRGTAFGGSISTLAILSAWTLVHVRLQAEAIPHRLVIRRNSVEYLRPIDGAFHVHCQSPSAEQWEQCIRMLTRKGKGRIVLDANIYAGMPGKDKISPVAGTFQGEYVALKIEEPGTE